MRERHAGLKPAQVKITSSLSAGMGHAAYMWHTNTHTLTHTHIFQLSMQYAHANTNRNTVRLG